MTNSDKHGRRTCQITRCRRDAVRSGVCKHHLIRQELGGAAVGDEIYVNDYGPFMIRSKTERANNDGNYVDTTLHLVGNRDDGSLWRMKVWLNDSGKRGAGRPGYCTVDGDGNRKSGGTDIHRFRYAGVPEGKEIVAEKTAGDFIDELR